MLLRSELLPAAFGTPRRVWRTHRAIRQRASYRRIEEKAEAIAQRPIAGSQNQHRVPTACFSPRAWRNQISFRAVYSIRRSSFIRQKAKNRPPDTSSISMRIVAVPVQGCILIARFIGQQEALPAGVGE